jgi:hypothetical protein
MFQRTLTSFLTCCQSPSMKTSKQNRNSKGQKALKGLLSALKVDSAEI